MGTAGTATAMSYYGRLADRYREAYRVAVGTVRLGNIVKWAGFVLGGLIVVINSYDGSIFLVLAALALALSGYVAGIFLCAQGQLMSALLDVAVNTSPHLQDSEKASVMTL